MRGKPLPDNQQAYINTIVYTNGSSTDAVYVGADIGVYYRDNTQAAWTPFMSALPRVSVRDLEIYYPTGKIRAGTYGRGKWESNLITPVARKFTIRARAGAGGYISPNGAVGVDSGTNKTFGINAKNCYTIADVLVDGVSQGAIGTYTFNNVIAPHTISATFSALTTPATPDSIKGPVNVCAYTGTGSGTVVRHFIKKVPGATSYIWTVPAGVSIAGGTSPYTTADSFIYVTYPAAFTTGVIGVKTTNGCKTSGQLTLIVRAFPPAIPGVISGSASVCDLMVSATNPTGTEATYTIRKVLYATSYSWSVPANTTITHPGTLVPLMIRSLK